MAPILLLLPHHHLHLHLHRHRHRHRLASSSAPRPVFLPPPSSPSRSISSPLQIPQPPSLRRFSAQPTALVTQPRRRRTRRSGEPCIARAMAGSASLRNRGEVRVFDSVDELSASLADLIAQISDSSIKERGSFSIALSGGSLISTMSKICEPSFAKIIDWSKWHVFWADERVVPRNHEDSNYKLAKDGLLSKVPIVLGQVYSINDALSADGAAEDYEFGLRQLVKTRIVDVLPSSDCPRFDLILLGMGPDGHVASLFPKHPLTHEKEKWIASIHDSPKPPPQRITFTFPVINSAATVAMVLTGSNKAEVLERAFGEELPPGELPVQMVSPTEGKLVWFLDRPAAAKL